MCVCVWGRGSCCLLLWFLHFLMTFLGGRGNGDGVWTLKIFPSSLRSDFQSSMNPALKPSVWHKTCSINWLSVLPHNKLLIHQLTAIFFSYCTWCAEQHQRLWCCILIKSWCELVCLTEKMHQVKYLYKHVYFEL